MLLVKVADPVFKMPPPGPVVAVAPVAVLPLTVLLATSRVANPPEFQIPPAVGAVLSLMVLQ